MSRLLIAPLCLTACVLSSDVDSPFGTGGPSGPADGDASSSETGDTAAPGDTGAGSTGEPIGTSATTTASVPGSSSDDGPAPETGSSSSSGTLGFVGSSTDVAGSTSTTGSAVGMQPPTGMWADCAGGDIAACAPVTLCISIVDPGDVEISAFCSEVGCGNPALDCDPAPGGTATPICIPVEVDAMAQSACALDCSGGAQCPFPMVCEDLGTLEICS